MMTKITFIAALVSLTSSGAFASMDLSSLDQFLIGDPFQAAFHAGDQAEVEKKSCVASMCDSLKVHYKIVSVEKNEALIQVAKSDGSVIEESHISEADWTSLQHNRLRQQIQIIESYGFQVEIESISPSRVSVPVNGEIQNIETRLVTLSGQNGAGMKTLRTFEIASGIGGLAQILRSTENKTVGTESTTILQITRP